MSDRRELSAALSVLFAATAYMATTAGRVGLVYYWPVEGRWSATPRGTTIAMDWFARAGWTLVAMVIGAGVGWIFAARIGARSSALSRAAWQLGALVLGWAAVFTVLWLVRASS